MYGNPPMAAMVLGGILGVLTLAGPRASRESAIAGVSVPAVPSAIWNGPVLRVAAKTVPRSID
jgi:hypothetical protein